MSWSVNLLTLFLSMLRLPKGLSSTKGTYHTSTRKVRNWHVVTDNCPFWISQGSRMDVESISLLLTIQVQKWPGVNDSGSDRWSGGKYLQMNCCRWFSKKKKWRKTINLLSSKQKLIKQNKLGATCLSIIFMHSFVISHI